MITTYFRSSSYNCHDSCPMSFFGEYILGWRGPSGLAADKGTIVHKILEVLANGKKIIQEGGTKVEEPFGTYKLNKNYILSKNQVEKIIEDVFGWYSERTHHNWTEKDFKDCRKWVWKALEFQNGEFDPRKKDIVEAEASFDFEIMEPWAHYEYEVGDKKLSGFLALKGTIDQVNKISDGVYDILDWKSGAYRKDWNTGKEKTHESFRKDPQLLIYYYAASKLWPDVEQIIATIYYINAGGPFTICFTKEDLFRTEEMLRKKFEVIKATQIPQKNITWKCKKFCHMGKTTFEGTGVVEPLINKEYGHITSPGEVMSKCEQLDYTLKHRSPESVMKHLSAPGHELSKYNAPGQVD